MTDNRRLLDALGSDAAESDLPKPDHIGLVGPYGGGGQRVLIIDDNAEIIENYIRTIASSAFNVTAYRPIEATFYFYALNNDRKGGQIDDLLAYLERTPVFDGIYIDGDLSADIDGADVAKSIQTIPKLQFQPMAYLTQNLSWAMEKRANLDNLGLRVILKFQGDTQSTLYRLFYDLRDLEVDARTRIWNQLYELVSGQLNENKSAREIMERVGDALINKDQAEAWYCRLASGDSLKCVAMHDAYNIGELTKRGEVSPFLQALLGPDKPHWTFKNGLTARDVGASRAHLLGKNAIATVLRHSPTSQPMTLTVYRDARARKFLESDARELHNLGQFIKAAFDAEWSAQRMTDTAEAISRIMNSESSAETADSLRESAHRLSNTSPPGGKTKTTVRILQPGTGGLRRWGNGPNLSSGDPWGNRNAYPVISVADPNSSVAESLREKKPLRGDLIRRPRPFLRSVPNVKSFLVAPLEFEGAVLGVLNLEADYCDAYSETDEKLAVAMAKAAAAAIFSQRNTRFLLALGEIARSSVAPSLGEDGRPEQLLQRAAHALFQLTGYSNLALLEAPDAGARPNGPWRVVEAWTGDENSGAHDGGPTRDDAAKVHIWNEMLRRDWDKSHLKTVLSMRNYNETTFFENNRDDIAPDDGQGAIRAEGRKTLSQLVIRIGPAVAPDSLLMMLFEHPWPLPKTFRPALGAFAGFMSSVYDLQNANVRDAGTDLERQRLEARRGRLFAQIRHNLIGEIAKLKAQIDLGLRVNSPPSTLLKNISSKLVTIENSLTSTRVFVNAPQIREVSVMKVWNSIVAEQSGRAKEVGLELHPCEEEMIVVSDDDYLRSIVFLIVDNAIIHAAPKGAKNLRMEIKKIRGFDRLSIEDDGIPIAEAIRARMFEPGFTTSTTGTGQGLYLTRELAGDVNAAVEYEPVASGNRFVIIIPGGA